MPATALLDRGVVGVEGAEARAFLDGLVTCDVDRVGAGTPRFGALLSPQGKILFDFHLWQVDEGAYRLDVARAFAPDLVKRLSFYRLRAKIALQDLSAEWAPTLFDGLEFADIARWVWEGAPAKYAGDLYRAGVRPEELSWSYEDQGAEPLSMRLIRGQWTVEMVVNEVERRRQLG